MDEIAPCPLTPAQLTLLATCVTLRTTDSEALARCLCRTEGTVRVQFHDIFVTLAVDCRYAAIRVAEEKGWLHFTNLGCRDANCATD